MAERGNREISGLASEEVAETPACLGADLAAAGISENGDDLAEGWAQGVGESTKARKQPT